MSCAYCQSNEKMTREHILPKFIYNFQKQFDDFVGWNDAAGKMVQSEHLIKDVCANCNNGVLSELDAYAKLFMEKNGILVRNYRETELQLKYNYDRILRWMLKVSFNSARRTNKQSALFDGLHDYIIGRADIPKNKLVIMAQLLNSVDARNVQAHEKGMLSRLSVADRSSFSPFMCRISYLGDVSPELPFVNVRMNIFGPFAFYLLIFDDDATSEMARDSKTYIQKRCHNSKVLLKTQTKRKLKRSSISWLDAYQHQLALQGAAL